MRKNERRALILLLTFVIFALLYSVLVLIIQVSASFIKYNPNVIIDLIIFVALLSFLLSIYLTSNKFKGTLGEWRVARAIKKLGFPVMNNVILDNGTGHLTQIDHLVLLNDAIAVIETKAYSGDLFPGHEIQRPWLRVSNGYERYIQSPEIQNLRHIDFVLKHVGDCVPVVGYIVMVGSAAFPVGKPPGIYSLSSFRHNLAQSQKQVADDALAEAWDKLKASVRTDYFSRINHRFQLFTGSSRRF